MKRAWKRIVVALELLSASVQAQANPPDGSCILPPGEEKLERRSVTLPGGAELALAWIPGGKIGVKDPAGPTVIPGEGSNLLEQVANTRVVPKEPIWMTADGFWIGVCEVTQKQWESVMGSNPSYFRGEEFSAVSKRAELPVECVSWDDCMEFCRRTGLRLPTEIEWRLANASFLDRPRNWTIRNSKNRTHPAGRPLAGFSGLYDMDGNVCEWCSDWFASWPGMSSTNYAGASTGTERVLCGGCWCVDDWFNSHDPDHRISLPPSSRYNNVGFRVCLTPAPAE